MVVLREKVYQNHLPLRPEMADYLKEAEETIRDPDLELDDAGGVVYVRWGLGREDFDKCFLRVPTYNRGDHLEVATFFLTGRVGRGRITWKRPR